MAGNGLQGVACPKCGSDDSRTLDSRPTGGHQRRRRECNDCKERFTTQESIVHTKGKKPGMFMKSNNLPRILSDEEHISELLGFLNSVLKTDGRNIMGVCISCGAGKGLVHREGCIVRRGTSIRSAFIRTEAGKKKSIVDAPEEVPIEDLELYESVDLYQT